MAVVIAQPLVCLFCRLEDLSSVLRTCLKMSAVVASVYNLSAGMPETGGLLVSGAQT